MNHTEKRLRILSQDEIEDLYGRPRFTHEERIEYFSLSPTEKVLLEQLHSIKSRAYCILQMGYFKARHLFYVFSLTDAEEDVKYIKEQYFSDFQFTKPGIAKATRLKQQRLILDLYNYHNCGVKERKNLETKARQAARVDGKPIYIFRELMHYLEERHIISPGYSFMQDTIGKALMYEENRLIEILRHHLQDPDIDAFNHLLEDSAGLHEITQLKREPKDFSLREIKRELNRGEKIRHLYHLAKKLLPELNISNESIKYYASLVTYYSVFRLKRFDPWIVYIYLLCFVYHRYQKLHDNLINSLIYNVRRYMDEAKNTAKDKVYEYRAEGNQNLHKAGYVLKLFTDDRVANQASFEEVRAKAFNILERGKLDSIADHLVTDAKFDETAFQWEHLDDVAQQFKLHLRPILLTVDWATSAGCTPLITVHDKIT